QLELARAGLVPGQLPADRVAAAVPPVLRRRLPDRSPDRLWRYVTIAAVARELERRLGRIFLRGPDDPRPVFGTSDKLQTDLHFRDHLLFYEYFDGDNGRGLGASHQTGWTGLIAALLRPDPPP